ncbi:AMP-binding protein [Variovorax sp. YR216]|uniref:AMP-binding protein n=1 Tax=Variovorax sp. YR216 TaxID=1882828 RepID=UPI00089C5FD8|nr:AMP-binding protein [Variovorax sp. YR216]SEB24463.1 long-chain acyl-CoA synthetase [Variovorax sp. YR216]
MLDPDHASERSYVAGAARIASPPEFETVHDPIAYWAARTPKATAIDDGSLRLSFEALAEQIESAAKSSARALGPAPVWVDEAGTPGEQLVSFLRILAAGDSAAVGDPDWSPELRCKITELLGASSTGTPARDLTLPPGSFYVGFTSGSTGVPKGFVRSHRSWTSSFEACLEAFGPAVRTPLLAPGRLSHSLFLFGALMGLWSGAGVRLQSRFSAGAALQTLGQGDARSLIAVPSQLIVMLEQAHRHGLRAIEKTQLVMIGGAAWPRARTPQLQSLFPNARIVEFYGASETSFIAWTDSRSDLPATAVGRPFASVDLRIDRVGGAREDSALAASPGLIYVRSPMVFTDYVTPSLACGATILRDGEWLSVGDMGHLDADGVLHLVGRKQRMFVVQGKNLFPEEVEQVLTDHPSIAAASVQAVPDGVRGMHAVAVLELVQPIDRATLADWCRARLEPYKTPRRVYVCADWPRTTGGKTDHAALTQCLAANPEGPTDWQALPWRLPGA